MEKNRIFFVIDMKSFFASCECADRGLDPMRTKLVVADESRTSQTVCLAITPALKACGVRNRCRLFEIPSNLEYMIVPPRMKRYIEYASEIYAIYLKYIDKNDIHVYSIDECFLDVTTYLELYHIKPKDFAIKLLKEIKDTLQIPASLGIGTNMYLAKIALDITAKSSKDKIGYLDEELYKKTLWDHKPITDFWQVSRGISTRLEKYGIYTMKDLAHYDEDILYNEFGINAELLIDHAWGRETCLISDVKNYKGKSRSISSSQILPCNYSYEESKIILKEMIQNGCYDLARQNYYTQLLHIFVGYGDNKGEGDKGTVRMSVVTNLYSIIIEYAEKLFDKVVNKKRPIRKIGYDFSELKKEDMEQYDFFSIKKDLSKEKKVVKSVINIKDKHGKNSLVKGLDLNEKATQIDRNAMIGGHRSGENKNAKK